MTEVEIDLGILGKVPARIYEDEKGNTHVEACIVGREELDIIPVEEAQKYYRDISDLILSRPQAVIALSKLI